ncbi:peptide-methionine (R)-S-oxide reductase MsrB [Candidatus Marinimicrobia bacterium]|nr:peptide-methionine (R)-S-oxide reductase MsrB [Candidatus Neomarinimicrobiota bacterium]
MPKKDSIVNLTKLQIEVTQNCGTEKPFDNEYWDNKEEGVYVDINDGTPLFCSLHKYDSGSGWPSFYETINNENIDLKEDLSLGYKRNEVRTIDSNSHLGHVFNDGPQNKTGLRYCINSASLKFIPKHKLVEKGYSNLLALFNKDV